MNEETLWQQRGRRDPDQARNYIDRFAQLRASGADLDGEARFVDTLVPRGARVLDAGCGTGRVGGELAQRGHLVTGVDLDTTLINTARADFPQARWLVRNLASLDLRADDGIRAEFDAIVAAGNVLAFAAPQTQREVLVRLGEHLAPGGRLAVGFAPPLGYSAARFAVDADAAGLVFGATFSTWDMRLPTPDADFVVALLQRPQTVN